MTDLIAYLLANRHRIPNRYIIYCLVLAQLNPDPRRRVPVAELMDVLGTCNRPYLSKILNDLARLGLLEFSGGTIGDPGYFITRIGPA